MSDRLARLPAGWGTFWGPRYRAQRRASLGGSLAAALAADAVAIPFLLALGASPVLVSLLPIVAVCGAVAVGALPAVLDRFDGRLALLARLLALGDLRGAALAAAALAAAAGWLPTDLAIGLAAAVHAVGSAASIAANATFGLWNGVALGAAFRFIAPARAEVGPAWRVRETRWEPGPDPAPVERA